MATFNALDAAGATLTIFCSGTNPSNVVPVSCPTDGIHILSSLFDLDTSGSTHEWNMGLGIRISGSGGSIEAKGQQTMANSLPVALAVNQSAVPISGTVTSNAGTNLNTSALALESGGNLATLAGAVSAAKFQCTVVAALPAGTNVIGHVIVDSGTITTVSTVTTVTTVTTVATVTTITNAVKTNADTTIGGTTAPANLFLVGGKSNDGTAQYQPIPLGAGGRSTIVEGFAGGTAVPISGTVTANAGTNLNTSLLALEGGGNLATLAGGVSGAKYQCTVASALPAGTANIGQVSLAPQTTGGLSVYSALSTAAVLTAAVKASAGQVYGIEFFNNTATPIYVRLYNMTTAPASTDGANIIARFMVPGNTAGAGVVKSWDNGFAFSTGIGIRASASIADNDTTALSANTVIVNVEYK